MLPPSRHQRTNARRFHVLNVTFRPISSERRQHTSGRTDSHETIKPFSWKEADLKSGENIRHLLRSKLAKMVFAEVDVAEAIIFVTHKGSNLKKVLLRIKISSILQLL